MLGKCSLSPDALPKAAGSTNKYSTERSDDRIESKVYKYDLSVIYSVLNTPDLCVESGKYSTLSLVERWMNARSTIPSRHFRSIDLPLRNTSLHNFHSNAFIDCILHSCIYYYLNNIFKRPQRSEISERQHSEVVSRVLFVHIRSWTTLERRHCFEWFMVATCT